MPGKSPGTQVKDKDQYEAFAIRVIAKKNLRELQIAKVPRKEAARQKHMKNRPKKKFMMKQRKSVLKDDQK